jgi:tRNA G18 (ribose-2'-O)-methylase SpoU
VFPQTMPKTLKITTRNARFQQWQALLANRGKRQREGEFLVQGVRPITLAVGHGWPVSALLCADGRPLSRWADGIAAAAAAPRVALAPDLLGELGGKDEDAPELVAVVRLPEDRLDRIPVSAGLLAVVFDRPTTPGNIGALVRSADAFGAAGVIITGHAADPYDPKAVRAASHRDVLGWVGGLKEGGVPAEVVGTDEDGDVDLATCDLTGPRIVVIGNETRGLSASWREASERIVRIPITGAASSLNAAMAGTIVLYEAARQRAGV